MAQYDLTINQNATFVQRFILENENGEPQDISNWEFRGSIKQQITDPDPPPMRFICVGINSDLYSPSGPADPENPTPTFLEIKLAASQTEQLTQRRYVYDIIGIDTADSVPSINHPNPNDPTVDPDEVVYRLLEGRVRVNLGVTDRDPNE